MSHLVTAIIAVASFLLGIISGTYIGMIFAEKIFTRVVAASLANIGLRPPE